MPAKKDDDSGLELDDAVKEAARKIREEGHVEILSDGVEVLHPPWDSMTRRRRCVQGYRSRPPELPTLSLLDLIHWPIPDKASLLDGEPMDTWGSFKKQNKSRA
jgi:hypothetical protein